MPLIHEMTVPKRIIHKIWVKISEPYLMPDKLVNLHKTSLLLMIYSYSSVLIGLFMTNVVIFGSAFAPSSVTLGHRRNVTNSQTWNKETAKTVSSVKQGNTELAPSKIRHRSRISCMPAWIEGLMPYASQSSSKTPKRRKSPMYLSNRSHNLPLCFNIIGLFLFEHDPYHIQLHPHDINLHLSCIIMITFWLDDLSLNLNKVIQRFLNARSRRFFIGHRIHLLQFLPLAPLLQVFQEAWEILDLWTVHPTSYHQAYPNNALWCNL